ncbi:hypothetical protein COOONC_07842, partial [Cooperia oncophora]
RLSFQPIFSFIPFHSLPFQEEEFENTRKNHHRALESIQASLESESRGRAELLRMKKKLESDINIQVEEEQRLREEAREQIMVAERRAQIAQQEKDDLAVAYEQAERSRRQAEFECADNKETAASLSNTNAALSAQKRKLEGEIQQLHTEMEDALSELKSADDRARKSAAEAVRLTEQLQAEHEQVQNLDKARKALESQLKEMQARLDEAEAQSMKGGKRAMAKLDAKCRELESELEAESRRHTEAVKNLRNKDRRCRELQFQVDEDKKSQERMYDLIEKLQQKIKTYKRQVEDAFRKDWQAQNLAKYRQLQHALEDAEERADAAENALAKMRLKNRSGSYRALSHSMSSTGVNTRSSSRGRMLDDGIEE